MALSITYPEALPVSARVLIRSLTAALNDSMSAEYTNFALSKGLSRKRTVIDYAFRNAGITGVSILGIQVGHLVGGALVVENVFAIPGVGSLLMEAVLARDYDVVQAWGRCGSPARPGWRRAGGRRQSARRPGWPRRAGGHRS